MPHPFKNTTGFTLVELMIVVAIIGILAAIAVPQFSAYRTRAINANALALLKQTANAQSDLNAELGSYGESELLPSALQAPPATGTGIAAEANSHIAATSSLSFAATATVPGGRIAGTNNATGKQFSIPLGIGANLTLWTNTPSAGAAGINTGTSYNIVTRHFSGDTAYGYDSDVPSNLYSVNNPTWPKTASGAITAKYPANAVSNANEFDPDNSPATAGFSGGGLPFDFWSLVR